eukprot:982223-Rhodomonas_salina.1
MPDSRNDRGIVCVIGAGYLSRGAGASLTLPSGLLITTPRSGCTKRCRNIESLSPSSAAALAIFFAETAASSATSNGSGARSARWRWALTSEATIGVRCIAAQRPWSSTNNTSRPPTSPAQHASTGIDALLSTHMLCSSPPRPSRPVVARDASCGARGVGNVRPTLKEARAVLAWIVLRCTEPIGCGLSRLEFRFRVSSLNSGDRVEGSGSVIVETDLGCRK